MSSMSSFSHHPSIGSMPSSPNIGIVPSIGGSASNGGSAGGGSNNNNNNNNNTSSSSCLQHRDLTPPSPYQCHMSRGGGTGGGPLTPGGITALPPGPSAHHHGHPSYESLGLSYGNRHSPCSPSQGYQMNGSAYGPNASSTGKLSTHVCH